MSTALANVVSGHRPLNRRRWLVTAASCSALGAGLFLFLKQRKAPARVVWRRVREKGFNVESWQGHCGTADWNRRQIYSFALDGRGGTFQAVDLRNYTLAGRPIKGGPIQAGSTLFHPQKRELWIIEGGHGEVFALDPETTALRSLGGGPQDERHFTARTYWNPVTGRAGIFGGYGHFAVRNDRCEFDPASKTWIELEADREDGGPWRRSGHIPLIPDSTGTKLFLVGGHGSRSGKQGEQMTGVRAFGGQFHLLDDVWELDLKASAWRCLLPPGHFDPMRLHAAAYFPNVEGLVIFEGLHPGVDKPSPTKAWLLRPGIDQKPVRLPAEGSPSRLGTAWCWTTDPEDGELVMFADDGIFRIAVIPT
jgi:hypothetical protein